MLLNCEAGGELAICGFDIATAAGACVVATGDGAAADGEIETGEVGAGAGAAGSFSATIAYGAPV